MAPFTMKTIAQKMRFLFAFVSVTVLPGFIGIHAQDFAIETKAPESVAVCGDPVEFAIKITRNTSSAVQGLKLYPAMPSGMNYIDGSVSGAALVSGSADLAFALNDFTGITTVTFRAKATCDLVAFLESSGSSNLVHNDTRLTYTQGAEEKSDFEPNGSESYSVLYPELELSVPDNEKNMGAPFINHVMSRHISIKNSGLGSVQSLTFYLKTDAELFLEKLELVVAGGNSIISSSMNTSQGRMYSITNFSGAGDGDNYFEEGETLNLVDYVHATTMKGAIETIYTAQWGCDNIICNAADRQATFAAYVEAIGGKADIIYNTTTPRRSDFCNDAPTQLMYTFRNAGSGNYPTTRDAAFNFQWMITLSGYDTQVDYHLDIIGTTGNIQSVDNLIRYSESSQPMPNGFMYYTKRYAFDFDNVFPMDPDGAGNGLDDVDGDGFYDDLPVGATLSLAALMKITFQGTVQSYKGEGFLSSSEMYQFDLWSGQVDGQGRGRALFELRVANAELAGVADLTSTKRETFTLNIQTEQFDAIHEWEDATYDIIVNVPAGMLLKRVLWGSGQLKYTQNSATQYVVRYPFSHVSAFGVKMEFDVDCSQVGALQGALTTQVFYYSDPACPSARFQIADIKKDIFLHCNNCAATATTDFSIERKTLGWALPNQNTFYTYGDLFGASARAVKVTRTTPGVRLDAAYPKDEVGMSIDGQVVASTNSLLAEIRYTSPLDMDLFRYSTATFEVKGSVYTLGSNFAPEVTFADGVYTHTYTIPLGSNGIPAQLTAGQLFKLNIAYTVDGLTEAIRGEYAIGDLRGRFYSITDGESTGCLGYGGTFKILRPLMEQTSGLAYYYGPDNRIWLAGGGGQWANAVSSPVRDFPNEYRPLFYMRSNTITLPKGFVFDQSQSIEFLIDNYSGPILSFSGAKFSADGRSVTLPLSDKMPVAERSLSMYAFAVIDCSDTPNKFVPVTTNYDDRPQLDDMTFMMYPYLPVVANQVPTVLRQNVTMSNMRRAALRLTANSIQEGYGATVEWPVQLCNPYVSDYYAADAPHAWAAFELEEDDESTILAGVKDEQGKDLEVIFYGPIDSNHRNGRFMMVKLETVRVTACMQLRVVGRYVGCKEDSLQDIAVYAGWDYHQYPGVSNNTKSIVNERASCESTVLSETMSIKYKTAALQWAITKHAPEAVDMCTGVPFDIDLTSTRYGNMRDLKVWAELPEQASFNENVRPVYYYPVNSVAREIPADAYIQENGKQGWDVSKILGGDGDLPGTRIAANKIRLSFQVSTSCGFDPGLPIVYHVTGNTNCGDDIEFVDQRKIKLLGVSPDSLVINVTGPSALSCFSTNVLGIHIRNAGAGASSAAQLELTLPFGTEYRELVAGDLGVPAVSQVNNQTVLRWAMPAGYLTAGQEKALTVRTYLSQTASGTTVVKFRARTFQAGNAHCSESNTACSTQVTSGLSEVTIPVTGLEALDITYRKYTCAYQFIASAQASGNCAVAKYAWSFGDGGTSAERSPFHTYAMAGNYTVSLRVDFNCGGCSGSQSKQITLNVTPNEALLKDTVIDVVTDIKKQVIQVSASTFADSWPTQQLVQSLADRTGFLSGTQGVWRNEGVYVYDTLRSASEDVNLRKDGTFSMSQFKWLYASIDAIPAWTKATGMTQYSPYSYELENRDVLGIYSSALYDYGGHLPSANGVNMRNSEMAFTSFEGMNHREEIFQDTSASNGITGNWIFGEKSLPDYYLYAVKYAMGNTAIVEASLDKLKDVLMVDVIARDLHGLAILFPRFNHLTNDEIICVQPYPQHPEWTIVVLKHAPFEKLWHGVIKVHNKVLPKVAPVVDDGFAHSGNSSLLIRTGGPHVFKQQLLHLDSGKNYMINAWVSVHETAFKTPKMADTLGIDVVIRNENGEISRKHSFVPSGNIIEGWQQVRGTFTYSGGRGATLELNFHVGSKGKAWYDDLRFHPEQGNMKSYVYDLKDYRLRAILDEENFASYFYYDAEGNLYLTKKETEKGVKTISENVSSLVEFGEK